MYITMDVTFVETETFFPPNSPFQGETRQEEQNWTELNWPSVSEIHVEPRQPEHVSLATEHHEDDHEAHVTSPSAVPENPTPENDPEVSSFNTNILAPPIGYVLPNRHNRGKPPSRYSPDIEERRSRYPIANYVSTKKLNEPSRHLCITFPGVTFQQGWRKPWETRTNLNWSLHQFDVKNAFLHGGLEEEVYMDIPLGYSVTTGTNELASEFEMKNLGGLKYFLRIEVADQPKAYFYPQRKYVLDLLSEVGLLECKPVDTPIVQNHKLGIYPNQKPTDKGRYQRLVGKLIYLSHTRPDIAYAVSVVSQFMHCPSEEHMEAVIRILRYLKSSPRKGLMFSKNDHVRVDGYTDADWARNISDRKSTSGYFTFIGGNLVTWKSKKQKVVALSSAEAEFRGMAKGLCELLWLKRLLTEIGFAPKFEMNIFCDNKAAIDISHNLVQHDQTKHVEVDRNFIKYNLETNTIQFPFVKSEDQLADILTKSMSSKDFHNSLIKLRMKDPGRGGFWYGCVGARSCLGSIDDMRLPLKNPAVFQLVRPIDKFRQCLGVVLSAFLFAAHYVSPCGNELVFVAHFPPPCCERSIHENGLYTGRQSMTLTSVAASLQT
ncbi:Retrovirus-related Pol polyprotein from transposon RE1 [Vitis vinifera]|uniref:Retrovirus-related Pol polyprotein from transposon RE1 n=1 Tax=Vitis vinifera TaxID=29760 RepID=A0A438J3N0_VITVI|nr:Retrovirus-related Pol polyprotein from transposon RE1 [Vitis vinifera]